jgi:hypothetical protein
MTAQSTLMDRPTDSNLDQSILPLVDRLLLEQGRLDPLELLLAADLLTYDDYEAWRTGRRPDLQGALHASPEEIAGLLDRAGAYARGQRLAPIPLDHRIWGGQDAPLLVGAHAGLSRACATGYAPPPDRHQLDLFQDSTAMLLEEEIRRALAERRTDRAREQAVRLMQQEPTHPRLRGFLRLIQTIDDMGSPDRRQSTEDRLSELDSIEPLALQLLGHRARDFMSALWAGLAESLTGVRFDPGSPRLHASLAWARAGRWEAARLAVEGESDWRERPELVLTHAEACWHRRDPVAARRDWMWLCWEYPLDAERAIRSGTFPDLRLADLWNTFGDLDEALETEDFPSWLLLRDPGVFAAISPDWAPSDDRGIACRLLHRMVTGDDTIERRRDLGDIHPGLLRLFLAQKGR